MSELIDNTEYMENIEEFDRIYEFLIDSRNSAESNYLGHYGYVNQDDENFYGTKYEILSELEDEVIDFRDLVEDLQNINLSELKQKCEKIFADEKNYSYQVKILEEFAKTSPNRIFNKKFKRKRKNKSI